MAEALVLDENLSCGTVLGGEDGEGVLDLARRIEVAGLDHDITQGSYAHGFLPTLVIVPSPRS